MAPSADSAEDHISRQDDPAEDENAAVANQTSRQTGRAARHRSLLTHASEDELLDLLCVGFGPASLGIAVALHDFLERSSNPKELEGLEGRHPRVAFLERQPHFAWHAGMLLPGTKMQITFMKDLATLRNPRSEFTFINYLHQNNRLVEFSNLGTFLPQRVEYEDYMRWCASWFEDVVQYNQHVLNIRPEKSNEGQPINHFSVTSKNRSTGHISMRKARKVVIAAGGHANLPAPFAGPYPRIYHSSFFNKIVHTLLPNKDAPYKVAVVGAGQSAAEIFDFMHKAYPNCQTRLLIRDSALRPSDDSPFVNEIFNPSRVDDIFQQTPSTRASTIAADRATNYSVVRLELLEHIYETLYTQRLYHASEDAWPHRILPHRHVERVAELSPAAARDARLASGGGVRLHVRNESGYYRAHERTGEDVLDVDAVFVAAGYNRKAHETLLADARHLMPERDREAGDGKWRVGRDYRVVFEEGTVDPDAGVWLQGCCEGTHGLSDTLLSIVATRAGELVESMFATRRQSSSDKAGAPGLHPNVNGGAPVTVPDDGDGIH